MTRKALTVQQIAAAASGAASPAVAAVDTNAPSAETNPSGTAPAATTVENSAATPSAQTESKETTEAPAQPAGNELVSYLQTQLAAAQAEVVELKVKSGATSAELASLKTKLDPLAVIAGRSLSNMRVALGLPAIDCSKLGVDALLADHAAMTETFEKTFKVGGVAAVSSSEEKPVAPVNDSLRRARVAAATYATN